LNDPQTSVLGDFRFLSKTLTLSGRINGWITLVAWVLIRVMAYTL